MRRQSLELSLTFGPAFQRESDAEFEQTSQCPTVSPSLTWPDGRILATYTVPPHHDRVALVTPLISGGSLAGVLDFRESSPASDRKRGKRSEEPVGGLEEDEIKCVTRQVVDGLAYLHEQGFLHVRMAVNQTDFPERSQSSQSTDQLGWVDPLGGSRSRGRHQ